LACVLTSFRNAEHHEHRILLRQILPVRFRKEREENQAEKKERAEAGNRGPQIEHGFHPAREPDEDRRGQDTAGVETEAGTRGAQVRGKERGKKPA
jgi:hypothetical protein